MRILLLYLILPFFSYGGCHEINKFDMKTAEQSFDNNHKKNADTHNKDITSVQQPVNKSNKSADETITLGAGCFWCTEAIFKRISGVKLVPPGIRVER